MANGKVAKASTNVRSRRHLGLQRRQPEIRWKGEFKGKKYEDKGVIVGLEREKLLKYTHFSPMEGKPDKPENYHTVTIELEPEGSKTRVSLSQDNNATDDERKHSEENWSKMLESLKKLLEQ